MQKPQRLIDVREYAEFANGHIVGSENIPLATLQSRATNWRRDEALLLVCKSGRRAQMAQDQLTDLGFQQLTVLPGGIDAWTANGKPLSRLERRPWSMERQIRIVAGSLVLVTLLLAFELSRYFLFATALVGAGLVFAGVSDICMMASLLARLPWNRVASRATTPANAASQL
ncbi:rhodanese-like domain-containing protein [Granulicella paludicola]|uniref:rhodanese-like domain-containing protein n=1 Tax=Granulicella paludicola TaxID=474951 RepID=UPI0021E0CB1F|nr:rhodanese-like domain-containing protein [Granulicella paludicola]